MRLWYYSSPPDPRNEKPQWLGWKYVSSTRSELGRGNTRLSLDARNEQPQWQGWKYVEFF